MTSLLYMATVAALAALVCLPSLTHGLTCWDYCDGNDDPTKECNARHEKKTCSGAVACRKTSWDDSDIVDRSCVIPNDPLGVYPGLCYDGEFLTWDIFSCQCDDKDECNSAPGTTFTVSALFLSILTAMLLV